MKLIKPSFTIIEQGPGIEGVYKQIELAGRTCYKSEDKITETSAKEFVDRMIKSGHGAMLEHGTVYLHMEFASKDEYFNPDDSKDALKYHDNKFSKALRVRDNENDRLGKQHAYITTNLRVLVENNWMDDLKYLCEPTEYHERRITVKFTCDRGVTHEFVRHRVFSFAQESTRYCNYTKEKFGSDITFIEPCWDYGNVTDNGFNAYKRALAEAERYYFLLIEGGWKAQEARAVLPNSVKADLVMTGFTNDWAHFFYLRTAPGAHPQARELAQPLEQEFIIRRYL